jgi:hypothetical protein
MAQWTKSDAAGGSPIWAPAQVQKAETRANANTLYGNTTADAYNSGATVGVFGADASEVSAARAGHIARPAHAGWQLTKTGSGGRAGRVQHETLVALKTMSSDGSDDAVLPDLAILIGTQPSSASGNSTANDVKTFSVVATTVPAGGSLSYIWQKWGGSAFANLSNAGAYSNTTTATLSVKANTASNGEIYRARISATGATAVFSSNAVITITT